MEMLGEAAGIAEAKVSAFTGRRPRVVEVNASVRPRRIARWTIDAPVKVPLSLGAVRWYAPSGERGPRNPLHSIWVEFQLLKKSPFEAFTSEPFPLPTRPPDITALLLSEAEVKPAMRTLPRAVNVALPQGDMWQRLRERKKTGILPT